MNNGSSWFNILRTNVNSTSLCHEAPPFVSMNSNEAHRLISLLSLQRRQLVTLLSCGSLKQKKTNSVSVLSDCVCYDVSLGSAVKRYLQRPQVSRAQVQNELAHLHLSGKQSGTETYKQTSDNCITNNAEPWEFRGLFSCWGWSGSLRVCQHHQTLHC